jgi:hypothetical protein
MRKILKFGKTCFLVVGTGNSLKIYSGKTKNQTG